MKLILISILALAFAGCAAPSKTPDSRIPAAETDVKKDFPKCAKAYEKTLKAKTPAEEVAPNMIEKTVKPEYPENLKAKAVPGCVVITFEVTKDGLAENFMVLEKTNEDFSKAALTALMGYKFRKFEQKNRVTMITFQPPAQKN